MPDIDFRIKMSFQRAYRKTEKTTDKYLINKEFESDRGRIINSAALRRLQQKTQVFPLERNAAVRSRLTHSLEVQQVGRHIVKTIIEQIDRQGKLQQYHMADYLAPIESVVEMACLLHDIGNPPFGHFGENAINRWFNGLLFADYCAQRDSGDHDPCKIAVLKLTGADPQLDTLRSRIRADLCHFEGNAQSIRIVHTLQKLNLTYAQVACILKYTGPAWLTGQKPDNFDYLLKKPGYYLAESHFIKELRQELQMGEYHRYPLTYIMEAADDISYCVADLEDAVDKGILTVDQLYEHLQLAWGRGKEDDLFSKVVIKADESRKGNMIERSKDDQFFMSLRVNTIAHLVPYVAQRFIANLPQIFTGTFNQALLDEGDEPCSLLKMFKQVAFRHVFNYADVELLELQGDRIISGLLDIYSPLLQMKSVDFQRIVAEQAPSGYEIETRLWHKLSVKQRLAYQQACTEYQRVEQEKPEQKRLEQSKNLLAKSPCCEIWEFYYRARLIQDYISGMTDNYAYDEYRRLMALE